MAAHGMLRKALDLAARDGLLDDSFFDETDHSALRILTPHCIVACAGREAC